jgi:hypothetical protein
MNTMTSGAKTDAGDGRRDPEGVPVARQVVNDLMDAGLMDDVLARIDAQNLRLTGEGGFLPEMIKAVLERGLQVEMTDHLGYAKHDPAGRGSPNSRNGSTSKTLVSEVGQIPVDTPRDRAGSFEPPAGPQGGPAHRWRPGRDDHQPVRRRDDGA